MGIERTYGAAAAAKGGLETGRRKAQQQASREAAQRRAQLQARREQQQYQESVRQMRMQWDIEAESRARAWQIEKMEMASRADFIRKETERQRKLGNIDSKLEQLEKEKEQGRFSADERAYASAVAYWQSQKDFIETGVKAPPVQQERYGVQPYWMRGQEAPEGTPGRQLYEAKLAQQLSPQRMGTVPTYLDPRYLRTLPRGVAEQVLMSHDIFFDTPEQLDEFLGGDTGGGTSKQLDADTARMILLSVGGDKEKAREIARQKGFTFE